LWTSWRRAGNGCTIRVRGPQAHYVSVSINNEEKPKRGETEGSPTHIMCVFLFMHISVIIVFSAWVEWAVSADFIQH
jgi:hypothetical protein